MSYCNGNSAIVRLKPLLRTPLKIMILDGRTIEEPNPFCTRRVRPGSIDYVFDAGENAAIIVARLEAAAWQGEIVGPHGSGKSTLLAAIFPEIRRAGRTPVLVELHDGQRRLPVKLAQLLEKKDENPLLIVDGYEQLGRWARWRLDFFRRRRGLGLLVTSHRHMGFPLLCRTRPTLDLAAGIVDRLLDGVCRKTIFAGEIEAAFCRCRGNVREMLFELYDLYENRRREQK